MNLFPRQYDLIAELCNMEKLVPKQSDVLLKLSKVIRNKIWDQSLDEKRLACVLSACNQVFEIVAGIMDDDIAVVEMYVWYLMKHWKDYCSKNISGCYNEVLLEIQHIRTRELIKEQWDQLNPYNTEPSEFEKSLIEIFDDFYSSISDEAKKKFLPGLETDKFCNLLRGRRGIYSKKEELAAPSIEIAKENNTVNRWNPPDKRYLYLVAGDGTRNDIDTSLEEMRMSEGETITVAKFVVKDSESENLIADFDYEAVSFSDIDQEAQNYLQKIAEEITVKLIKDTNCVTKEKIDKKANEYKLKARVVAELYAGQILLKNIVDTIFEPLDDETDKDPKKKDIAYKSFHVLALYFEDKGYAGICYPSTRMKKIGKNGRNLVLFDADLAEADEKTFQLVTK